MPRARNIKPGFFKNDLLAEVDPIGRLLFAGLWTLADRDGRLENRHKRIKAEILPYDNCDVKSLIQELENLGFLITYEVEKKKYIQIANFNKHQNPHHKEPPSEIPALDKSETKPGQEQDKTGSDRADSGFLIPDSLNLIPDSSKSPKEAATPYSKIIDLYHETCKDYPKLIKTTEKRKQHIAARYKEYGEDIEVFEDLFTKAQQSEFLKGHNDRDWKADFDWLMNQTNMAKVLEGKYEKLGGKSNGRDTTTNDEIEIPAEFFYQGRKPAD